VAASLAEDIELLSTLHPGATFVAGEAEGNLVFSGNDGRGNVVKYSI